MEKLTINFVEDEEGRRQGYDEVVNILSRYPQLNAVSGGMRNIEVTKKGISKASGLLWLGEFLGIPPQEMIAFGDSGNDLEMIKAAGVGVAMGNAEEEVKEAADFVTLPNTENGIVYALQKYGVVLGEGEER